MEILSKEKHEKILQDYYESHYGARKTDEWFETTAVNACTFKRDGKYVTLISHVLTGEVREQVN